MIYAPEAQSVAARFPLEMEEFRTVARLHDVPAGTPERLAGLPLRLSRDWRLRSSFVEMIRALQTRDPDLSLPDALTLLTLAIGGPSAVDRNPALDESINLTAGFLASLGGWPGSAVEPITDLDNPSDHDPRLDLAAAAAHGPSSGAPAAVLGPDGTPLSSEPFGAPVDTPPSLSLAESEEESAPETPTEGTQGTVALSAITEALARLERGNLELRLHLDSIDQRISRMEPLLESTPHAADLADLRSEAQLLRELAPDAPNLHDLVPGVRDSRGTDPTRNSSPADAGRNGSRPVESASLRGSPASAPVARNELPPDQLSRTFEASHPLPSETRAQELSSEPSVPVAPPRDLVHRNSSSSVVSPTPETVLRGRRISLEATAAVADAAPLVKPPLAAPSLTATDSVLPDEVHARPRLPRRDRFAAARELPGSRGDFDEPFHSPRDPLEPEQLPDPFLSQGLPLAATSLDPAEVALPKAVDSNQLASPGSRTEQASLAPLRSAAAAELPPRAAFVAAPTPPLPISAYNRVEQATAASATVTDNLPLASSHPATPATSPGRHNSHGTLPRFLAAAETVPAAATDTANRDIDLVAPEKPERHIALGPVTVGAAALLLVGASGFLLIRGTPIRFLEAAKPAVTQNAPPATAAPTVASAPVPTPPATPSSGNVVIAAPTFVPEATMDGQLLSAPRPVYPEMASLAGVQGRVVFEAMISRNGDVEALRALGGHTLLRGAAADAVRQWKYRPFLLRGRPVEVRTIVRVEVGPPLAVSPAN